MRPRPKKIQKCETRPLAPSNPRPMLQPALDQALTHHADEIRAVLTNGAIGFDATSIARLPNLELIGALGAGYENIARDAAQASGIVVVNGAGTNEDCVADHA